MVARTFPLAARVLVCVISLSLMAAACTGEGAAPPGLPVPVDVIVNRSSHVVPPGTTLGELLKQLHVHVHSGKLRSVSGSVLDPYDDPGRILLNGSSGFPNTVLRTGDAVRVIDGTDRTEGVRRTVEHLGWRVGNPERTLDTYRTDRVTVTGRISGEVVSVTDVSKGTGRAPRAVALTFDDGPWPNDTRRVMAVLQRYHVPATFFEIGYLVQRDPDIVKAVLHAGFHVENHSWDHPESPPLADLTDQRIASEIADANTALRADGADPTLFRPPGGSYDDTVVQEARDQGMRIVLWSVDPRDWVASRTPKQITHAVLSQVEPGSIILLHDGGGDAGHTIAALPKIIKRIRARGLRFVFVPVRA
jgi:peptidoglycan-N-acetylglucosamine deacetylase